ncbi:MAG TPA: thioesterase family protein [Thermoclostridium caenicola]|mgnify:CR=1 FL=1|uniref:Acyl-CoA thioester hydrolase n=1 Tax=Thermoclostridium caenicola TaxID=659425 RepID=A0A1M6GP58_9FIRM|nr:thioesterase family protein [Thermoclostridium caenicola]SHJ11723.1 acyl-CoA thioester hydrolase [Thermoclostridium caenicola]HOK42630.1 thioesterase family protein [Thermoclostridium caenicola]HOL84143.1 thioesterase family protein [Thermoclostridium caenicola]HOP72751.1 thioesterase family protein [Thermoclostridium caenicola]HPO76175.1 thioesterase family protein [Thermoclostridium caenicola]
MATETRFPVRYAETDQMGIVHHSVYPVWFECGRTEHIKSYGLPYDELERLGIMLPLIRLEAEYKKPVHYGETVVVRTSIAEATKVRLLIAYEVYVDGDPQLRARGCTEHVWTSSDLKPVNLAKYRPDIYERLIRMFNEATGERPGQ